jgi:hypothetical protein
MTTAQRSVVKLATGMDMNFAALDHLAKSKSPMLKNPDTVTWMDAAIGPSEITLGRGPNERVSHLL